ncbi:MAG: 5'-methylthioadenosine/S-adenosylhomocysteine nucleosidase [Clostridia bacterium]|nr:5'-methylthioadenosine/S-adenosylhomocysteine nucleosidase [Clostridia bacterium]
MNYKKIGIIVADEDEYNPFIAKISGCAALKTPFRAAAGFTLNDTGIIAVNCGIGKVNAAAAAMYLIDSGCDLLLNFGLSGGIKNVRRGDYILPEKFLEHDFDLTPLGYAPCEKPGQAYVYNADKSLLDIISSAGIAKRGGTAVCGDRFVSDSASREFLINTFSATSCDMETAAVAGVCSMTGIPFLALRRISDDAGEGAAESYGDMNTGEGVTLGETFFKCLKIICEAK